MVMIAPKRSCNVFYVYICIYVPYIVGNLKNPFVGLSEAALEIFILFSEHQVFVLDLKTLSENSIREKLVSRNNGKTTSVRVARYSDIATFLYETFCFVTQNLRQVASPFLQEQLDGRSLGYVNQCRRPLHINFALASR